MPFRLPDDFVLDPDRGFFIHRGIVAPDWTDRNGHMNVVYYRLAFDRATQAFLTRIGLWDNDHDEGSTFALEDHVTYQRELHPGQGFFVTYQLLDFSEKLVHAFLRLYSDPENTDADPENADADPETGDDGPGLAATCEHIGCYVDMRTRRSAPMPAAFTALLEAVAERQRGLAPSLTPPPEQGRVIGIRRRPRPVAGTEAPTAAPAAGAAR